MGVLGISFKTLLVLSMLSLIWGRGGGEGDKEELAFQVTFNLTNACPYIVWVDVLSGAGSSFLKLPGNGGFALAPGGSVSFPASRPWSGRLWGRRGCSFASSPKQLTTCASADCNDQLECEGVTVAAPATLAEFTLAENGSPTQDFYDISVVDGYNMPISITPQGGTDNCGIVGCNIDLNLGCFPVLQVVEAEFVVACRSACNAFQLAKYCCSGPYNSPSTCTPSAYTELFKSACPRAYSYAYDDPTSIYTCAGTTAFTITFCPTDVMPSSNNNSNEGVMPNQPWNSQYVSGAPPTMLSTHSRHKKMMIAISVALSTMVILCGSLENCKHMGGRRC